LYALVATLARSADAGAVVGVVLLANATAGGRGLLGVLAAALTAPHLAGPLIGPVLDRSARPRAVLGGAFLLYSACLTSAALSFAAGWMLASFLCLVAAGACGPLLTGGLSSQLGGLVSDSRVAQRRAQAVDALTYGLAATCGPVLVALLAGSLSPMTAVVAVAGLPVIATVLLTCLPLAGARRRPTARTKTETSLWKNVTVLFTVGPLRRVTIGTSLTAFAVGALPLLAIASAAAYHADGTTAAIFVSAFGIGNLAASIALTLRPLRGSAERAVAWSALGIAGCLVLCIFLPTAVLSAVGFGMAGAASAIQFTSSLAVRAEFSPSGRRADVFVTMAGLKVACSSLGVAAAGVMAAVAPSLLLSAAAVVTALAFLMMRLDAVASGRHRRTGGEGPRAAGSSRPATSADPDPARRSR
jgi:hypothetical protein